jgi:hypothetical protein
VPVFNHPITVEIVEDPSPLRIIVPEDDAHSYNSSELDPDAGAIRLGLSEYVKSPGGDRGKTLGLFF